MNEQVGGFTIHASYIRSLFFSLHRVCSFLKILEHSLPLKNRSFIRVLAPSTESQSYYRVKGLFGVRLLKFNCFGL
jgi:hypothetical protein